MFFFLFNPNKMVHLINDCVDQFQHRSNALSTYLHLHNVLPMSFISLRNIGQCFERMNEEIEQGGDGVVNFIAYTHFTLTKWHMERLFHSFYHLIWRVINRITLSHTHSHRDSHQNAPRTLKCALFFAYFPFTYFVVECLFL